MNLSSSLISLHLASTRLQGNFPSYILSSPILQELDLSHNDKLRGQFPKFNWNTPLRYLDISSTAFSGGIPDSIGNLKSLKELDLSWCKLNGQVPLSLWNLTQLTDLSLAFNNLNGEIPSLLSNLKHLTTFNLDHNNFSGLIPEQLDKLINLEFFDLSDNMLDGTIPHWVILCHSCHIWILVTTSSQGQLVNSQLTLWNFC